MASTYKNLPFESVAEITGPVTLNNVATETTLAALEAKAATEITLAALEAKVATETTLALLEAKDFATETTLAALAAEDFATETTLAALAAEDFATETTLALLAAEDFATETTLALLAAEDFATETTLSALNAKIPTNLTVTSTRLLVDGSGVTQPISAVSLPLPTGAATETTLASIDAGIPVALGQTTMANSMPVVLASNQSTIRTDEIRPSSSSVTSVAASATSTTLLASNSARIHAFIFNDSNAVLYVKLGATASATSFTVKLAKDTYFELPEPAYTGIIDGIWASATGSARITEIT